MCCNELRVLKLVFAADLLFSIFSAKRWVQFFDALSLLNVVKTNQIHFVRLTTLHEILDNQVENIHNCEGSVETVARFFF